MNCLKNAGNVVVLLVMVFCISVLVTQEAAAAWESNTDRAGMDLTKFTISKDVESFVAVQQCETACTQSPQCKAFTYVKPGIQGPDAVCYLKKGVPSATTNTCCISGVLVPESAADRCANYAATARYQAVSNEDWECGYSGPQWSTDYKKHFNSCLEQSQSAVIAMEAERAEALEDCWNETSSSGDLAAQDWCYYVNEGKITFYPIVQNVGNADWKSKQEGYYAIGVEMRFDDIPYRKEGPAVWKSTKPRISQEKYTLAASPKWSLNKGESKRLSGGVTVPFDPVNFYYLDKLWMLEHPEDTNAKNNSHPGGLSPQYPLEQYTHLRGSEFERGGMLWIKRCKFE